MNCKAEVGRGPERVTKRPEPGLAQSNWQRQGHRRRAGAAGTTPAAAPYTPSVPVPVSSCPFPPLGGSIPESHLRQSVRSPIAKEHLKPTPQEAHSPVPGSGRRRPSFSPGLGAQDEVPAPPRGRNWNAWRGHTLHSCVPGSSKVASETSRPQEGWSLGKHRALGSGPRVACTASTRIFCERWLREREGRWR